MEEETPNTVTPEMLAKLRTVAESGDAEAQFRLGVLYGNGEGVELDREQAMAWFKQSARQGHEDALITMAWMYANGSGVDTDEAKARELYQLAADHGSVKAMYVVGTMYRFAQYGAEKDIAKAIHYYTEAANKNFGAAQFALGRMLMDGKQVERDPIVALQWLMLADSNGSKRAEDYIKHLLAQMTPEEIEQARSSMLGKDN